MMALPSDEFLMTAFTKGDQTSFDRLVSRYSSTLVPEQPARYRIVGDASGVVAYTPSGVVVGVGEASSSPERGGVTR